MTNHEYEKERILNRLKHNKDIENCPLYSLLKNTRKKLLEEANEAIDIKTLDKTLISSVKEMIEDLIGVILTENETKGFLKLYTQTALTIIQFGIDTESVGRLSDDLFNFFLFDLPSPENGHSLSEEETEEYYKHIQHVAFYYGFKTVKN